METAHSGGVVFHPEILPKATQRALDFLSRARWLNRDNWYLAGGTALALQVGHRSSVDLDFFTPKKNFYAAKLIDHLKGNQWETDILSEGTVYGRLLKAKVSFLAYPFFIPGKAYGRYGVLRILDPQDIAIMKIIAISQRGRKRDFVDLYWYCMEKEPLIDIVQLLPERYPEVSHNYHHILKSLAYFADAEKDPMPKIFFDASWKKVKKFFEKEVLNVANILLKLR